MTVPRLRSTPVRDPERRQKILDAAADLMAQRGYADVNLMELGAAAGIVGSGIYRHFDSKVSILIEMFEQVVDQLIADAARAVGEGAEAEDAMRALVRRQVRFVMDDRTRCQVYLREERTLPDLDRRRLRRKQWRYIRLWQDVLGILRPDVDEVEREVLIHVCIAGIQSALRFTSRTSADELAAVLELAAYRSLGIPPL